MVAYLRRASLKSASQTIIFIFSFALRIKNYNRKKTSYVWNVNVDTPVSQQTATFATSLDSTTQQPDSIASVVRSSHPTVKSVQQFKQDFRNNTSTELLTAEYLQVQDIDNYFYE